MIDFERFTNPNDPREYVQKPFSFNGRSYATTNAVMVFKEGVFYDEMDIKFDPDEIVNKIKACIFSPLSKPFEIPEKIECKECKGSGKLTQTECEECEGEGVVCFSNDYSDYECDCESCGGNGHMVIIGGDTNCTRCNGTGQAFDIHARIEYGSSLFDAKYINLIAHEENLEVGLLDNGALAFRVGEVMGIIMNIRR